MSARVRVRVRILPEESRRRLPLRHSERKTRTRTRDADEGSGRGSVGSDLDVVLVVEASDEPFESRGARWDLTRLPVPADVLVYTAAEWEDLLGPSDRFSRMLVEEAV